MKKIIYLILFFVMLTPIYAFDDYGGVTVTIVDGLGQKDSVRLQFSNNSSNGIDTNLGEVNLYNVPYADPEIRIIQRDFVKYFNEKDSINIWLAGMKEIKTSDENIDLKIDHRRGLYTNNSDADGFVIKIAGTNYPITIMVKNYLPYYFYVTAHDTNYNYPNTFFMLRPSQQDTIAAISGGGGTAIISFGAWEINDVVSEGIMTIENPLYPNPVNDWLRYDIEDFTNKSSIEIFDLSGNKYHCELINENGSIKINVSKLAHGNYYLLINNQIKKFIKE